MIISGSLPKEVLKMALDSILANKFRSFLTILGIVIGIITAIVVASILTGVRQSLVKAWTPRAEGGFALDYDFVLARDA